MTERLEGTLLAMKKRIPLRWDRRAAVVALACGAASAIACLALAGRGLVAGLVATACVYGIGAGRPHISPDARDLRAGRPIPFRSLWGTDLLLTAAVLFAAWCLWIVPHLPGTIRDDTIPQMLQWYGVIGWYGQHPVFDTMVFGVFWSLGDLLGSKLVGLEAFIFVQAAGLAITLALTLSYARHLGAPKPLLATIIVLACLAPPVFQMADAMSKDSLNAIFVALASLLYVEAVRTDGRSLERPSMCAATVALTFLAMASRRTTMYVLGAAWAILLLRTLVRHNPRRAVALVALCLFAPVALFRLVWTPLTGIALHVDDGEGQSLTALSVPGQQVMRTARDHPERIDATTKALVSETLDYEKALRLYSPTRSDEIFWAAQPDPDPSGLLRAWVRLLPNSLDSYAVAFRDMAGDWLSTTRPIAYGHNMRDELFRTPERLEWEASFFGPDGTEEAQRFFADFTALPGLDEAGPAEFAEETVYLWLVTTPGIRVISSYGLWCFLIPAIALGGAIARKSWAGAVASAVPVLLLLSYLAGPMVLYWYSASSAALMPLTLGALPYARGTRPVTRSW